MTRKPDGEPTLEHPNKKKSPELPTPDFSGKHIQEMCITPRQGEYNTNLEWLSILIAKISQNKKRIISITDYVPERSC